MSQTITGTYSSTVTLTNTATTIASTARLTTGPSVDVALIGTVTSSDITVTNYGTIIGSNYETVVFDASGTNAATGTIINESGGLIDGSGGYGVLSYVPTVVENDAGSTITGTVYGVGIQGASASVTNSGLIGGESSAILEIASTISGTLSVVNQTGGTIAGSSGGYGIYLESGQQSVVNEAGGTIIGGVTLDQGGTVTNAGTIIGGSNHAVSFGTANATRLIVDPGAVFDGTVSAGASNASSNTIELAEAGGAGTLAGFGSTITNFNNIVFDSGAQWGISSNRAGLNHAVITGFAQGDTIDLQNVATTDVSVAYVANSGTVTVAGGGGSFTVAGAFPDLSAQSDGAGGTLLVVAPVITSDTASPATGDYKVGQALSFTLATSEAVTVIGSPTLTLNDGGSASYDAAASTATSLVFTATVAAGQNATTLQATGVVLPTGASIRDGAGNDAILTGAAATFSGLEVDTTAPSVTSDTASPATGDYKVGQALSFTLATSEAVTVIGSPTLTLNDGGSASYDAAASTATSLVFTATVAAGQNATTLQATGVVLPTGASIRDGAGNDAVLTGAAATFSGLEVDTTAPVASSATLTVQQNAAAMPIGIAAPSDNITPSGALVITVGSLPSDGTVTLADGAAPVTTGEALTVAQLESLEFTPTPGAFSQGSALTYRVADGAGNTSPAAATLAIGGPGTPSITGTHPSSTSAEAAVMPFSGVTITDSSAGTETLTIGLTGGGGTLSGQGLIANPDGTYTLGAASATVITAELDALSFTPVNMAPGAQATTLFTLTDASSAGPSASDSATVVTDMAAPRVDSPAPPAVAFDPTVTFSRPNAVTLTGTASDPSGIASIEIYQGTTDLGPATLDSTTGAWSFGFDDRSGLHTGFSALATANDGDTASASSSYDLTTGVRGAPYASYEDNYDPATGAFEGQTFFNRDGLLEMRTQYSPLPGGGFTVLSSDGTAFADTPYFALVDTYDRAGQPIEEDVYYKDGHQTVQGLAASQTLHSISNDTFYSKGGGNTFVFTPHFGGDTITSFKLGGPHHDTISLPDGDASRLGAILAHATTDAQGDTTLRLTGNDSITIKGISVAELKQHRNDFTFHA